VPSAADPAIDAVADLAPVVAGATAIVHLAASPDCAPDDPQVIGRSQPHGA